MSGIPASGVVTPEAVVLQFETGGVGSRGVAEMIDFAIQLLGILIFALMASVFNGVGGPAWLGETLGILGVFLITVGYSVAFETLWNGRTPGKAALGLRVVTEQGAPIRFRHAAIRGAVALIEIAATAGIVAFAVCFLSKRDQRIGDLLAGTLVLRERAAVNAPQAMSFIPPAGTEDYALSLDVSAINSDEYVTVRSFLLRATGLDPRARLGLSDQLGRQFAIRLRTTPPTWMPSEIFLVCVAAAYQRRYATA